MLSTDFYKRNILTPWGRVIIMRAAKGPQNL